MVLGPTPVKRLLTEQLAVSWLSLELFQTLLCVLFWGFCLYKRGFGTQGCSAPAPDFCQEERGEAKVSL